MSQSTITAIISVLLLLIIAASFLYFQMKVLQKNIEHSWAILNDKILLRVDMVPGLIETLRKYVQGQEKLISELMQLREKSWKLEEAHAEKVQVELALTADLHQIWKLAEANVPLKNDVNFLASKKEITDLGQEIDHMTDEYNVKIQHYNKRIGFILWRPLTWLMRFKKRPVFEFEA